ncbi:hypothetical protein [Aliarcobacter cryaerophilus]|uniref:hypothetical protein n=1 Tax=Aliarcobacter cryaerophilus TaxID=28198 RepID=UPI0021B36FD8|nr:hypothetical protein [Aliarcobacter cryaerophilus]MCT7507779.1 hypothetical protein [Aliarcobacter cryaerophilus]
MALTKTQVSELYVSIFNRASEKTGNQNWLNSGLDATAIANAMLATDDAKEYFGASSLLGSDTASYTAFVEHIYASTLNKPGADVDADGKAGWVKFLEAGNSRGEMVVKMIEAIKAYQVGGSKYATADQATRDAAKQFANRVEVSDYTADTLKTIAVSEIDSTLSFSSALTVTSNPATVTTAKAAVAKAAEAANKGETIRLTTGFDDKVGTDGNDTFKAPAYDNQNSFQSGDVLDGGAGSSDKLVATLGGSSDFAIRAETKSIEEVYFTSQSKNATGANGDNEVVGQNTVDAELMSGVREWWNDNSRAELTIEDVRSTSSTTTIGMRDTDAGGVNYSVYFDNQYITDAGSGAGETTLVIKMVNAYSLATDKNPVFGFETITFTVGDQPVTVDVTGLTTYAEVISAIKDKLDAEGITNVTVSAQADRTVDFSDDIGSYKQGQTAGPYTPILISSTGADLVKGTVKIGSNVENYNGLNTMNEDGAPDVPSLTQTNVVLDNVGRGSKSGVLEIGAMSQSNYSGSKGIQQFNIDVERSSWLDKIKSTNDSLEVLDIRNIAITKGAHTTKKSANGDLRVDYLKDVRVIDAAKMTGALTLTDVQLTDAVVKKYLELKDDASNPSADNSQTTSYLDHDGGTFNKGFSYEFGKGNDTMNLTISKSNLAAAGTTNREDFDLVIDGGAGNDIITTIIGDGKGTDASVWYINSTINANLVINGGEGNDTIWTKGAGNFVINAGSGNDTVYTDNTGADNNTDYNSTGKAYNDGKATFVLNAVNTDIEDLQSNTLKTTQGVNVGLTVTFQGITTQTIEVANSFASLKDVAITDLHVNQAIKKAIQNDERLNKVLEVNDGPGNTLVITSLIDGVMDIADFKVNVVDTTANLSTAQATAQNAAVPAVKKGALVTAAVGTNYTTVLAQDAAVAAVAEVTVVEIGALGAGQTYIFDGLTITDQGAGATAAQVAAVIAGGTDANLVVTGALATTTVSVTGTTATYTATTAGVTTDLTETGTAATSTVTVTTQGANAGDMIDLRGADSTAVSDNKITGGTGDDVIVLGTDATSNDTLVYTGAFGNDTIFNFNATNGNAGEDKLDFSALLSKAATGVAAGTVTTAATYSSTDTTALTLGKLLAAASINDSVTTATTSQNIVLLTDTAGATNGVATKAYVYQLNDGLAVNDATFELLGTITLADDGTDAQAWADVIA